MANVTVTKTTNGIKVEFNDLSEAAGRKKGYWRKDKIRFDLGVNDSCVTVTVQDEPQWCVTWDTGFIIDSVDGVAPTSNSDLYDKLIAILG